MHLIDWLLFAAFFLPVAWIALRLQRLNRSVADFMAANRCAGRYLLTIAQGAASAGVISIVASFEMYYAAGFAPSFWHKLMAPVGLVITLSGWIIYRYRETRALTMAQFFEMRYSRGFRIFAGMVAFLSGVINYGIFPGVTARFFVYFLGLPPTLQAGAFALPTYVPIMLVVLGCALFFVLLGGQIVIIVTDFIQGQGIIIIFAVISTFLFLKFDWGTIVRTLQAPQQTQASLAVEEAMERGRARQVVGGEEDAVGAARREAASARADYFGVLRSIAAENPGALPFASVEGYLADEESAGRFVQTPSGPVLGDNLPAAPQLTPAQAERMETAKKRRDLAEARLALAQARADKSTGEIARLSVEAAEARLAELEGTGSPAATALARARLDAAKNPSDLASAKLRVLELRAEKLAGKDVGGALAEAEALVARLDKPAGIPGGTGVSKINPFDTGKVKDFNVWFYLIAIFGAFYTHLAWQGTQGYNASAKNPHEARMAGVLSTWRSAAGALLYLITPIAVFVMLHNTAFDSLTSRAVETLSAIENPSVLKQVLTTVVIREILPTGLMGLFAAVMFAAAVATDNTYLHSWGSIFIQDVVMPFRKKPLDPAQHMLWLRLSIIGVAVFAFFFSWLVDPAEYILMFFAITGAIYLGGAGAAIIGGLYWKRGTTGAAYTAMINGAVIGVGGILLQRFWPGFPLNGQELWFLAMVSSLALYVVISLLTCRAPFNLEKMLHRGSYQDTSDHLDRGQPTRGLRALGINKEFTRGDRILYIVTLVYGLAFFGIICTVIFWNAFIAPLDNHFWELYWKILIYYSLGLGLVTCVWFLLGGTRDAIRLVRDLKKVRRDTSDDGTVSSGPSFSPNP